MKDNLTTSYYNITNNLLKDRRTVHNFHSEVVSESVINSAIESIRWAPNHYLSEPWRVYLIGPVAKTRIIDLNTEIVERKSGLRAAAIKTERWKAIPGWLLVNCIKEGDEARQNEDYAACCCGIQNLMLSFWAAGVGVKWTTGEVTRDLRFSDILGFDRNKERVVGLMWFGIPKLIPNQNRQPMSTYLSRVP